VGGSDLSSARIAGQPAPLAKNGVQYQTLWLIMPNENLPLAQKLNPCHPPKVGYFD